MSVPGPVALEGSAVVGPPDGAPAPGLSKATGRVIVLLALKL